MKECTFKTNSEMKIVQICKMVLMMTVVLIMLASCCKQKGTDNNGTNCNCPTGNFYWQKNDADFAVTNLRTNETVENKGFSVWGTPMEVHRNDSILLVYKKPQEHACCKFTITFNEFGDEYTETNVSVSQYTRTIVVNSSLADSIYSITCEAVSENWQEDSYDKGYVTIRVSE